MDTINEELAKCRDDMRDVEVEVIKYGGSITRGRGRGRGQRGMTRGVARIFAQATRTPGEMRRREHVAPVLKRRRAPSPEQDDDDELPVKLSVLSSIVPNKTLTKTRDESIEEQQKDEKAVSRGKRLFGNLLSGTLRKFRVEKAANDEVEARRKDIERRLEEKDKREHQEVVRRRVELLAARREQGKRYRQLHEELYVMIEFEEFEKNTRHQMKFVRTKAKPHIFYKPKSMNSVMKQELQRTKEDLEHALEKQKAIIDAEVAALVSKRESDKKDDVDDKEDNDRASSPEDRAPAKAEPIEKEDSEKEEAEPPRRVVRRAEKEESPRRKSSVKAEPARNGDDARKRGGRKKEKSPQRKGGRRSRSPARRSPAARRAQASSKTDAKRRKASPAKRKKSSSRSASSTSSSSSSSSSSSDSD